MHLYYDELGSRIKEGKKGKGNISRKKVNKYIKSDQMYSMLFRN